MPEGFAQICSNGGAVLTRLLSAGLGHLVRVEHAAPDLLRGQCRPFAMRQDNQVRALGHVMLLQELHGRLEQPTRSRSENE